MNLLEYKSISDDVADLADYVGNAIINDARSQVKVASEQTYQYFKENTFKVKVKNFLKGGEILTVNYILYFVKTREGYDILLNGLGQGANSEADEETNTIRIVSAFVGDDVADDFYETIYHELEHLYQYGMGFSKRENLYEKMRTLLDKGRGDINAYYVGLCCYYSFKHEQDAFVHQFYAHLCQNGKMDRFENLCKEYMPYRNMLYAYNVLIKNQDNKHILNAINYLGYSRRDFIKLVDYRSKRLRTKMLNAYRRFMEETSVNEHNVDGHIRRMNKLISESNDNGYDIAWSIESIYKF